MNNEEKVQSKISYIQVPNSLICNKEIKSQAVYLYIILKMSCNKSNTVTISKNKLLAKLEWNDNRTLKTHMEQLKTNNYIQYDFTSLPINKTMTINIRKLNTANKNKSDYFTQIDRDTIHKVFDVAQKTPIKIKKDTTYADLKDKSIRLIYLYEKCYNKEYGYAWISYREIQAQTGISNKYIKSINTHLKKHKILNVTIGNKYENNEGKEVRERNKYSVNFAMRM
jgi:hypothetical protein